MKKTKMFFEVLLTSFLWNFLWFTIWTIFEVEIFQKISIAWFCFEMISEMLFWTFNCGKYKEEENDEI